MNLEGTHSRLRWIHRPEDARQIFSHVKRALEFKPRPNNARDLESNW